MTRPSGHMTKNVSLDQQGCDLTRPTQTRQDSALKAPFSGVSSLHPLPTLGRGELKSIEFPGERKFVTIF